jgi:hypothetical protein
MLSRFLSTVALTAALAQTQTPPGPPKEVAGIAVNYNEAKVGSYTLPDPLRLANGKPVKDAKTWYAKRRPEIVRLFEENQFGRSPAASLADLTYDRFDTGTLAFGGAAHRTQTTIYFSKDKAAGPKMNLLLYLPAKAQKPVPVLLNIGFSSNAAVVNDPGVAEGEVWNRDHKKVPGKQGMAIGKIDVASVINAGFGFASVYYGDIEPDFEGGLPYGVRSLYPKPAPDEWGAIAAWSWGLSRALDYLEKDPGVDGKRVALYGASRLGKTVLWAAARDTRFAAVVACCSGEGGAALSRRDYGETIAHLVAPGRFPYQFAANYAKFAQHVDQFPVDANMLIALIAPRPLLLQTGDTDYWSDPKGEFLAAKAAGPVYELLGKQGLETDEWPPAGVAIMHTLGYYMHSGGHGTLPSDWPQFLKFLQLQLATANSLLAR